MGVDSYCCHVRWSCGPMNINYDKLPQLSPVDACERQGSRMGETQAWENLVEFFQIFSWVWSNVEHVRDREACNVIFIHSNDKFWRFGIKSILQNSLVQRILLPRQIGASLQFQAKEKPAAAEAVAKEIEEVGGSGTIGARFEERLWSILEVGRLKWPFGNPCDNVTASYSIKFALWLRMLPPKPKALPTQTIFPSALVRGRGTILKILKCI